MTQRAVATGAPAMPPAVPTVVGKIDKKELRIMAAGRS
jgi:hypothetical protein